MNSIGRKTLNLNSLRLAIATLLLFAFCPQIHAIERALSAQEIKTLQNNLKQDPKNKSSRRFLFQHYFRQKNWTQAVAIGLPGQADFPKEDLLDLARADIALDDGAAALAVIAFYHGKFQPVGTSRYLEGMGHLMTAKKELDVNRGKEKATVAIGFFKDAVRLDPKTFEAYFAWITALKEFWTQYHDDTIQVYKQLEAANGNPRAFLVEKCELYVSASLWEEAISTCQESVAVYPDKVDSYTRLATALLVKGDSDKALAVLQKAERRNSKSFLVQSSLGDFYTKDANWVLASKHYTNALKIDPKAAPEYLGLAMSEFKLKKYPEALKAFHQNCYVSKKLAKEFVNATGQLRDNVTWHNRYKAVSTGCQELKP